MKRRNIIPMDQRQQDAATLEQIEQKIARWERLRSRGLAIRVAVRATDLTVDLLYMDEQEAWDVLIARARRAASAMSESGEPGKSLPMIRMSRLSLEAI
jgi:hypothetical protein